jgi:hypothetical protein
MHKNKIKIFILSSFSFLLFLGIFAVERELKFKMPEVFLEKPFVPANIIVNVNKEFGVLPPVWKALAQGGEEPGKQMLAPTVSHLQRIKPNYIRLDHIYDDDYYYVVRGRKADGSLNLDWSRLDATVNDILSSGAKPFFSLSYMPGAIASSKINPPGSWQDWQNLVQATVEHYSSYIDNVYYEVWNEPSLPMFGNWKMYGGKDYRLLYHYAVLGAEEASVSNSFKIGGPSIPELDPIWISLLFDYVLENNLRLDFISWHRYSFDPAKFVSDVYEINVLLDDPRYQAFLNTEKIITEWGPNSYKDQVYSSPVAASHLLATTRKLLDKVSLAFAFEVKDGPGQGSYGWGLLTHESVGIKEKPRFYLFNWLADFEGQRLEVLGEGSQITGFAVKSNRKVSAILTNYNPYTPQDESFQFSFGNLAGGRYRFLIQELFSEPEEQELEAGSSIVLNLNMPAYSVSRLELTKLSGIEKEQTTGSGFGEVYYNSQQDRF